MTLLIVYVPIQKGNETYHDIEVMIQSVRVKNGKLLFISNDNMSAENNHVAHHFIRVLLCHINVYFGLVE